MTTSTGTDTDLLAARMAAAIGERMPGHIERLGWSPGQLAGFQRTRLRALLARAIECSPFHAARLAGIDAARFELADLPRLPVLTKAQMMDSFDDAVTDRRLSRDAVERHLAASAAEPAMLLGEYVCLVSGGSSGLRGVFVQTAEEYAEFIASVLRRSVARARASGGVPAGGMVSGIVAAASPVHSSGMAAAVATGPLVRLISAPASLPTARIVGLLNAARPPALIGHASKLAELAAEQREGRLRLDLQAITSISEMLTPADRQAITSAFGVPVINMFVSTEGLVGHSEPGGTVLTFASDTCIAECVDDAGNPVAAGTASPRVLITNLHNLTQPLIRYELTDSFTPAGRARAATCTPASRGAPTTSSATAPSACTPAFWPARCSEPPRSGSTRCGRRPAAPTSPSWPAPASTAPRWPPPPRTTCARRASPRRASPSAASRPSTATREPARSGASCP